MKIITRYYASDVYTSMTYLQRGGSIDISDTERAKFGPKARFRHALMAYAHGLVQFGCMRNVHITIVTVASVVPAQIVHVTTSTTVLARLARLRDPDGHWLVMAWRRRT